MIRTKLFQKYFLLASTLLLFFAVLGFFFGSFLMRVIDTHQGEFPAPLFYARMVDRLNSADKAEALREISSWSRGFPVPTLILLDEKGSVIYPTGKKGISHWDELVKPTDDYGYIYVTSQRERKESQGFFHPPPPGPPMRDAIVKLQGEPSRYLLIGAPERRGPPKGAKPYLPFIGLGSLVLSLLLGVGTTIAIVYSRVGKGVMQADQVISELHRGNLKARFEVHRKDEFGKAMMRFNFMAEEIEKLVLNLKAIDQSRTRLLQELAHDLRTPIASLRNLIETLHLKRGHLKVEVQNEMMVLALKEVNYFERLVEDLLLLAQVKDPSYHSSYPLINLSDILSEVAEDFAIRSQHKKQQIALITNIENQSIKMHGDAHLITRLLRNGLENAFSFAHSSVSISARLDADKKIRILVDDDGPGFSQEALMDFGIRRTTRKLENKSDGRLSVGLGSVVMKTIAEAAGGEVKVSNRCENGRILGARVEIALPVG